MLGAAATKRSSSPTFGSFSLLAKLARGDIGDLFLARNMGAGGFEKLVIIKRIHPELMKDRNIAELFMAEARTAARIEHPNVRIVYEIGRAEAHYYIALEYLEGVPLVDVLLGRRREKRLADTRLITAILGQACQGLHMAHTLPGPVGGLVHGDINPRSIFVTASGTAKILDFDIVEMRGALAERHGFVRRTSAYMSPEEVRTGQCDLRADIFSMGVVAWEALTGRRLFKQDTRERTMEAIDRGRIPNAQKYRPELSDAVNSTIMRALNRDPTLRFQSARDFGIALERAVQAEGPPLSPVNIASLIENTFAAKLRQQRDFVRGARNGEAAPLTATHQIAEEPETVLAPEVADPDDWNTDTDAATRVAPNIEGLLAASMSQPVAGAENFGAGIADPFNEIAASADYSSAIEAPQWTDTRNLVLSEIGIEIDDDAETGAVEIDAADDNSIDSYGFGTLDKEVPSLREMPLAPTSVPQRAAGNPVTAPPSMATAAPIPRMPSTIDPERPSAGYGRAPSTIDPADNRRLDTLHSYSDKRAPVSSEDAAVASLRSDPSPWGKRLLMVAIAGGIAFGAYRYLGKDKAGEAKAEESPQEVKQAAEAPSKPPAKNTGAGAAASILAAAGDSGDSATAAIDAGPALDENVAEDVADDTSAESESERRAQEEAEAKVREQADKEQADKEQADKERADKERADKERADKERADKERADKAKQSVQRDSSDKRRNSDDKRNTSADNQSTRGEPGFLTINATPYATVFVDGKKVGITPIVKLQLKPGKHKLKLVNSADNKSSSMSIKIQSAEVFRKNVSF